MASRTAVALGYGGRFAEHTVLQELYVTLTRKLLKPMTRPRAQGSVRPPAACSSA
jgi:hypothetical protein